MSESTPSVLIAAGLFPPDIGGPATYAAMVAESLPAHGLLVTVEPYGKVRTVPKWRRHITYTYRLWRASKDAEVIYALDPMSVGWPALIVSRVRRIPLVVRLGGDYAWEQARQRFGLKVTLDVYSAAPTQYGWRVRLFAWLQNFVVGRAALVIVPSQYLQRIVQTWPGVEANTVRVVYSALFPLPAPASREQVRSQLEYNGTVILTAARLAPWKGVEGLLAAIQQLPAVTLIVAGDGPERAVLEATAVDLGVKDRVRFVGALGKEALGAAVYGADVFVLNTAYEGLSHQLLEVMDLGVPIITTNVGGNPELIEDGVSGCLVAYDDIDAIVSTIEKVITSPETAERYVQNARLRVNDFSQESSVAQIAVLLKSVLP